MEWQNGRRVKVKVGGKTGARVLRTYAPYYAVKPAGRKLWHPGEAGKYTHCGLAHRPGKTASVISVECRVRRAKGKIDSRDLGAANQLSNGKFVRELSSGTRGEGSSRTGIFGRLFVPCVICTQQRLVMTGFRAGVYTEYNEEPTAQI